MARSQPLVVNLNVRTFQLVQTSSELAPRVRYGQDGSYAFMKLFPSDGLSMRELEEIFIQVENLRRIKSECLAQIFGVYQTPSTFGILTDWMPNGSLHSLIYQRELYPMLPFSVCIRILVDTAKGLLHLHSLSPPVAHQALKPCNILLDGQYRAKVSDFGLASVRRVVSVSSDNPNHKQRVYLSPERLQGEGPSVADDIYSFGMICWEMFSRQPPFHDNDNPLKLETCITRGLRPQPDMSTLLTARGVSPTHRAALMELVSCCWHLDPCIRPSMRRCLDHLQTILQTIPAEAMDSAVDFLQSKKRTTQNQILEFSMKSLAFSIANSSSSSRNRTCSEPNMCSTLSLNSTAEFRDHRRATLPCLPQSSSSLPIAFEAPHSQRPRQESQAYRTERCLSQMSTSRGSSWPPDHMENGYYTKMLITNREKILNSLTEGMLNHLLDKLRSSGIFCSADSENVEANKTLTDKVRMCLDICHQKGEEASMLLLQILGSFNVCLVGPRNPA